MPARLNMRVISGDRPKNDKKDDFSAAERFIVGPKYFLEQGACCQLSFIMTISNARCRADLRPCARRRRSGGREEGAVRPRLLAGDSIRKTHFLSSLLWCPSS